MKQLFLFIVCAALCSGCVAYREATYTNRYDQFQGMFITESNSVNFSYTPVGSVNAAIQSGYDGTQYIHATIDDVLYLLSSEAERQGANGIINLKIEYGSKKDIYGKDTGHLIIYASGMGIIY